MQPMNYSIPFLVLASMISACVYDDAPPRRLVHDPEPYSDPVATGSAGAANSSSSASSAPILAEVDPNQTMDVVGGDGVGVFIEYRTGGHWSVRWTCDTNITHQSCDVSLSAEVAVGAVSNVDSTDLADGSVTSPSPSRIEVKSTTTTDVRGVYFDTDPGVAITLDAEVGGIKDGSFLFFVQDGKVNGGYTGVLSNPIRLQGKAP